MTFVVVGVCPTKKQNICADSVTSAAESAPAWPPATLFDCLVARAIRGSSAARNGPRRRRKKWPSDRDVVSVRVFGVLRPAPSVRAGDRQGPPYSGSTRSPKRRHVRPKHLEALAGTKRSGVPAPSLPNSISEMLASSPPGHVAVPSASRRMRARLCENPGLARARNGQFFGAAGGARLQVRISSQDLLAALRRGSATEILAQLGDLTLR